MSKNVARVVYKGVVSNDYIITKEGIIRSIWGNIISSKNGRSTLTLDGKRQRVKIEDILLESFPSAVKVEADIKEAKPVAPVKKDKVKIEGASTTKVADTPDEIPVLIGKKPKKSKKEPEKTLAEPRNNSKPLGLFVNQTSNQSFIDVSKELHDEGVSNYKFMLWLNNPELEGVNVHNPTNRKNIRAAIQTECAINPWFYLRECVRIDRGGVKQPLHLTAKAVSVAYAILRGHNVYFVSKYDQEVNDVVHAVLSYFNMYEQDGSIDIVSTSSHMSNFNMNDINNIFKHLPVALRHPNRMHSKGSDGRHELTDKRSNNNIRVRTSPINQSGAAIIGAGMDGHVQWFSEFENINNREYLLAESGVRHESTIQGYEGATSRIITSRTTDDSTVYGFISNCVPWEHGFLDLYEQDLTSILEDSSGFFYFEGEMGDIPTRIIQSRPSVHDWFDEVSPNIRERAIKLQESLDFSVYPLGFPAIVLEDIEADGLMDNVSDPNMIRAFIIRRIIETLHSPLNTENVKAYDNPADTMFANFGTGNLGVVTLLLNTEAVYMSRYYDLLFTAISESPNPGALKAIAEAGKLTSESLHYILNAIKK